MDFSEIDRLYAEGLAQGRAGVVGCLVVRPDGRVFSQKRALTRKSFPGCWDLIGGHIEPGETPRQALERELQEETGWTLGSVLHLQAVVDWQSKEPSGPVLKREFVVAVTAHGDLDHPSLETTKVTEGRWFGPNDLPLLNEGRRGSDDYVFRMVQSFFHSQDPNHR